MSNGTSLEDFVNNYIQNKVKSNSKEGYERWLRANGIDSYGIYADAQRDITADYNRNRSNYGTVAERLGELGLSSAGYSDYVDGHAYSEMQKNKERARAALASNEAKNRKGYSEYLEAKAKEAKSDYKSATDRITDANVINYDEAYNLALSMGLDEEGAALAAKVGSEAVRKKTRAAVLSVIVNQRYNYNQTVAYALSLGLSEEESAELGEYADTINSSGYYSQDYLEYLKDKLEQQKNNE